MRYILILWSIFYEKKLLRNNIIVYILEYNKNIIRIIIIAI